MSEVKVNVSLSENNASLIKEASDEAIEAALEAVGLQAVGYAILACPVDTGRLRNSLVYVTHGSGGSQGGNGQPGAPASDEDMEAHGTPDKNTVAIGTNVEYAEHVERSQPYLGPAIQDHVDEYKQIIEETLKETLEG